jgi:inner membrane protein
MDSLTHIALGACMGEAFAGRSLGRKAMLWGALAQSLPDIDFISAFWMDTSSSLLAHRGFTHSFLFCLIVAPVLGLIAERWHRPHNVRLSHWIIFFTFAIFIHIFIDAFNNYGVGWFEPFSHKRISFNAIYVADPFFSIWPGLAFVALLIVRRRPLRQKWWKIGLGVSSLYLVFCLINKAKMDGDVKDILKKQHVAYDSYFTTPAPLQNFLWYVVAGNDSGFNVGLRSVFDKKEEIRFEYFPRNDSLLRPVSGHEDVQKLIRFSQNFYTMERWHDTLVFNDLRFGQIVGWYDPREKFVFHYFLDPDADNRLVVQRGRFAKWDKVTIAALLRRIRGN